jgi:hypothetical protein
MINYGKVISDKFSDIPDYLRESALSFYLLNSFPKSDFKYICLIHTDDMVESLKLSSKLSLTIKKAGNSEDEYNIKKGSSSSQDLSDTFLLRLEPRHKTGANEVHILKDKMITAYNSLDHETKGLLTFAVRANKEDLKDFYGNYKKGLQEKSRLLRLMIDSIIDLEIK